MPQRADFRSVGEFAATRHGVFTSKEAADFGIFRRDIGSLERLGLVERLRDHVWRMVGHPVTWRQQLRAATAGNSAVASHHSAAALHRLDGLREPPAVPEILCDHAKRVDVPGAVVHRSRNFDRRDLTVVDGIPCTTLARTLCDIAARIDAACLLRGVDDAQRRGVSMNWLLDRSRALAVTGRSGPTLVGEVVRRRLGGYRVPGSWFERQLQLCLASPLLRGMERQYTLRTATGLFVARFDLALPWVRLGIEGHSRSHHLGEIAERYDEDRDMRCAKEGFEIMYLGFAATRSPAKVRRDIEEVVERRAADLVLCPPPS